jgi:hypothetical protein
VMGFEDAFFLFDDPSCLDDDMVAPVSPGSLENWLGAANSSDGDHLVSREYHCNAQNPCIPTSWQQSGNL